MGIVPFIRRPLPRWARHAGLTAVALGGIGAVVWQLTGEASAGQIDTMRGELLQRKQTIDRLHEENAERRLRIEALKTDERAIEEVARDELGMVLPGEVVLRMGNRTQEPRP